MLRFLFSFKGRFNRAKFLLYWPVVFAAELVTIGTGWVIGWFAGFDDPMETMSPFFFETDHSLARWLGFSVLWIFIIFYFWTLIVVSAKRLHDRNKGAIWAVFYWLTPFLLFALLAAALSFHFLPPTAWKIAGICYAIVGNVILWSGIIEMFFLRGTKGENRFGPDPLKE